MILFTALLAFISHKVLAYLQDTTTAASELGWRFLEIHIVKIVLGSVMMLACYDVSNRLTFYPVQS